VSFNSSISVDESAITSDLLTVLSDTFSGQLTATYNATIAFSYDNTQEKTTTVQQFRFFTTFDSHPFFLCGGGGKQR